MPTGRRVEAGDAVRVDYTCRLPDGRLIASTQSETVAAEAQRIGPLFAGPSMWGAKPMRASLPGEATGRLAAGQLAGVGDYIDAQLAEALPGMERGERRRVTFDAKTPEGLKREVRYMSLARVRHRSKEVRQAKRFYRQMRGQVPPVGEVVEWEPGFNARVVSDEGDEVVLRIEPADGMQFATAFGEAVIRDQGDQYDVTIDPREGELVRTGNLMGRIDTVEEKVFVVDYGHPYGGAAITCDVTVNPEQ